MERLQAVLDDRLSMYTHARTRVAVAKASGVDRLVRGSLTFERGDASPDETRDYGIIRFHSKSLDIPTAKQLIQDLATHGHSDIMGLRVTRDKRTGAHDDDGISDLRGPVGQHYESLPSPRTARRAHEWPSEIYSLGPKSRNQQNHNISHAPIVIPGLPIVPDVYEEITQWTGIAPNNPYEGQNSLVVILPDFRARINKIRIGPMGTSVEIENGVLPVESINVRASSHREKPAREMIVHRDGALAHIAELDSAESLMIFLTDRGRGDIIDWALLSSQWYGDDGQGVEYTASAKQIAQRILEGESETLEFKSKLKGDRKGDEHFLFIQSVVAFANTNAGVILVGVQDDGTILGVESPDPDIQRIHEWVESLCEPPIQVETEKAEIDGKTILIVRVLEGSNKPYQHKSNLAFYLRRGSTDRPARRSELDEMYKKKASGDAPFPLGGRRGIGF